MKLYDLVLAKVYVHECVYGCLSLTKENITDTETVDIGTKQGM